MKSLRRFCASSILVIVLAFSVFAGEISTPGIAAPPPPTTQSSVNTDVQTLGATANETSNSEMTTMDSVTVFALYLLDSMMSSVL